MDALAEGVRARRVSFELKTVLFMGVALALGFAVIYPFLLLVTQSFTVTRIFEPTRYGFGAWRFALSDPGMLRALLHTSYVIGALQLISFPVAILICWLIARTDLPGGKWLEFLFWIAFFFPTVPMIQAWILLAHPSWGLLNQAVDWLPLGDFDRGPFNINSFWGIVWVHLMTDSIALKVMLLTPAFRAMDPSLEDASRITGAGSLRTLARVTVPVLTPALFTVLMLSLLRDVQSVEIEVLLGVPRNFFVFGSKISSLGLSNASAAMGMTVLLAATPLVLFYTWYIRRRHYTTLSGQYQPQVVQLRRWRWPLFSMVLVTALMMSLVPFLILLMGTFMKLFGYFDVPTGAWTLANWEQILNDRVFIRSLKNTVYLGIGAATMGAVFFTLLAYIIVRARTRLRAAVDFFVWVPYVMPGAVLALVWLIIALNTPFLKLLYGSMFLLIAVSGLSAITIGVQLLKSSLLQQAQELEDASALTGAGWFTTFAQVVVPLMMPVIMVVWVIAFVIAIGGAIIPSFLATPQTRPLSLLVFEYVNSGLYEEATVVGVIVALLTVVVAATVYVWGSRVGLGRGFR